MNRNEESLKIRREAKAFLLVSTAMLWLTVASMFAGAFLPPLVERWLLGQPEETQQDLGGSQ